MIMPFDHLVRVVLEQVAVLEAARLGLVGVADDEALAVVDGRHERPLEAGRGTRRRRGRAGPLALTSSIDLRRRHRVSALTRGLVAAVRAVVPRACARPGTPTCLYSVISKRGSKRLVIAGLSGRSAHPVVTTGTSVGALGLVGADVVAAPLAGRLGQLVGRPHRGEQLVEPRAGDALEVGVVDLQAPGPCRTSRGTRRSGSRSVPRRRSRRTPARSPPQVRRTARRRPRARTRACGTPGGGTGPRDARG